MPPETEQPDDAILVLPWNRLPNYLIFVVALINVVVGIATVQIAFEFTQRDGDWTKMLSAGSIGIFGLMLIWVGWCFRKGLLPVRFVADASRRECGFRWMGWWNGRFDLTDTEKLIGELRLRKKKWRWAILIPKKEKPLWIYGSSQAFASEALAEEDCRRVLTQLGDHLSLPFLVGDTPQSDAVE